MQSLPRQRDIAVARTDAPRPAPIPAYPGQSFDALAWGMNPYAPGPDDPVIRRLFDYKITVAVTQFTIDDGYVVISPGLDGVIVTADGEVLEEASAFRDRSRYAGPETVLDVPVADLVFEEAFVAFDQAWINYYHWLLYGLAKIAFMQPVLPPSCAIIVPDIRLARPSRRIAMTDDVYDGSIAAAGLTDRLTFVGDGIYRVRKLHCLWHRPRLPEYITQAPIFSALFDHVRASMRADDTLPRRIFISRDMAQEKRLTAAQQRMIDRVCDRFGFVKVTLETQSFARQAALFRNAEIVMAPHGAGLANLLFGSKDLKVLELTRHLDGQKHLRSCFYMLASLHGQPYMVLETDDPGFDEDRLAAALDRLIAA